jgi:cell division protein ZapD
MQETVLYEFPLNERMRNFMRLENHFSQITYISNHNSVWDSQSSLLSLIEILTIIDRNDIRSEVAKELERNIANLTNFLDAPSVNTSKLQQTLDELHTQAHAIQHMPGKLSRTLREDELLNSIRQRVSVASGLNGFDIPGFYYWLHQPAYIRQQQIQQWLSELKPIEAGVNLLNRLLRDSAVFEDQHAESGFFQKTLNPQQTCQMVRIELPRDANCFPETSGSKHRISIRFLTYESFNQRPSQIPGDIDFGISCCSI